MGEMADDIADWGYWGEEDDYGPDVKFCKYCGEGDLYWDEFFINKPSGTSNYTVFWRLYHIETGKLHSCLGRKKK